MDQRISLVVLLDRMIPLEPLLIRPDDATEDCTNGSTEPNSVTIGSASGLTGFDIAMVWLN